MWVGALVQRGNTKEQILCLFMGQNDKTSMRRNSTVLVCGITELQSVFCDSIGNHDP